MSETINENNLEEIPITMDNFQRLSELCDSVLKAFIGKEREDEDA